MSMTPIRTALLAPAALALATLTATAAQAQSAGWQILPGLKDPNFKAEASIALTGNRVMPDKGGDTNAWGIDFNMNCGLIQSPDKRIRTHVNFSRSNKGGVQGTNWELSPRYTAPVLGAPGLSLAIGPTLGMFQLESAAVDRTLYGVGAAVGANYRVGPLFTGLDLRYHFTGRRGGVDLDPLTWGAKVGVNF
jgi:hypothetical protein